MTEVPVHVTIATSSGVLWLALVIHFAGGLFGAVAIGNPVRGVPTPMIFFIGTVALLAALGDWRLLRAGSIAGARRLARHLWRMCFGLFIASGSFFLGQAQFLPKPLRIFPLLAPLGVAPLFVLLYWMWRIRLRKRLQGMILRTAVDAPGTSGAGH